MTPSSPQVHLLSYALANGVTAFSTERGGGYSTGPYASFNANAYCGDDTVSVARNRQLLATTLGIPSERLVIPHQVHGTTVRMVDETLLTADAAQRAERLEGVDALITRLPGVCLCVSTADCIPVVIYDPAHHAAAAIHAGWRGTRSRIVSHTLETLRETFGTEPQACRAAIGPGISLESFEVGDEVYDAFLAAGFPMRQIARRYPAHTGSGEKWHIDLPECNRQQLCDAGLQPENIESAGICTFLHADRFFSARRLGVESGRILTGILLR